MEPTGKTSKEVKVPKLAKNGQNWKIYCAKIIKAAATDITDPLGVLAGWQPDDGSYDWECLDAILKWTFYTSVPITILRPIRKLDTAHEIFNYLVKRFCDNNPITDPCTKKSEPSANKVNGAGTATEDISADLEKWKGSPTSESAATETLASANRDGEDLSTIKDLTQGMKSVDNGNVGHTQDPRTSLEASAQGTSAKRAEMTPVVLKSTLPHEMQTELHSSLLLTPRLPIEGEPNGCKQEAADSMVTAGCMKGMVETAKPTEIVDINRTALLGGKLAERACGVDEGDGMECEPQMQLLKEESYCEEIVQCSGITNEDVPSAQRLLLEGEWTVCMSGELLMTTVEPYANDGNRNACVYLGGMRWCAGDASRPKGQSDVSIGQTDMLDESHSAETANMSHSDSAGTYLGAGGSKCNVEETDGLAGHTDGVRSHADMS